MHGIVRPAQRATRGTRRHHRQPGRSAAQQIREAPTRSARRTAFSRTGALGPAGPDDVCGLEPPSPQASTAWMRATSPRPSRASVRRSGMARSRRSTSRRCAVSRHHAFGCSRVRVTPARIRPDRVPVLSSRGPRADKRPLENRAARLCSALLRVIDDLAHVDDRGRHRDRWRRRQAGTGVA